MGFKLTKQTMQVVLNCSLSTTLVLSYLLLLHIYIQQYYWPLLLSMYHSNAGDTVHPSMPSSTSLLLVSGQYCSFKYEILCHSRCCY